MMHRGDQQTYLWTSFAAVAILGLFAAVAGCTGARITDEPQSLDPRRSTGPIVSSSGAVALSGATDKCEPGDGDITKKWECLGGKDGVLGDKLTGPRSVPGGDMGSSYMDFERGQIVWSPTQKLLVAAYEDRQCTPDKPCVDPRCKPHKLCDYDSIGGIVVDWNITSRYHYDFFLVRWHIDGTSPEKDQQSDQLDHSTSGSYRIPLSRWGRYTIAVEGCDRVHFLGVHTGDRCLQRWSMPTYVDTNYIDMARKVDGSPLDSARTADEAETTFADRALVAHETNSCRNVPRELDDGEAFTTAALAKLWMVHNKKNHERCSSDTGNYRALVNDKLRVATTSKTVGTDFHDLTLAAEIGGAAGGAAVGCAACSLFGPAGCLTCGVVGAVGGAAGGRQLCDRRGDYDMALKGLLAIMYRFPNELDADTYQHVLHDLLTEYGGADKVRERVRLCGVSLRETENHILMTETSRYLTNQLRFTEVAKTHPPGSPEYEAARLEFDNQVNGMNEWMLKHLQHFLVGDFHEYNARPYARLSVLALQNLYEFTNDGNSNDARVKLAARMVLDYLAAKFAVSSNGLRRAVPFRRLPDKKDYTPLFWNDSDAETWRFVLMAGNTQVLKEERHGRVDWGAWDTLELAGQGSYRLPDLILDLIVNKAGSPYFQRIHHEGVEIYASSPQFLITGGGIWMESKGYDRNPLNPKLNEGWAMPTTLMPSQAGADRSEFIRIDGHKDDQQRANTCVLPGFACGLNPVIPSTVPPACIRNKSGQPWFFVNFNSSAADCNRPYGFYVAVYKNACDNDDDFCRSGGGTFGFFEAAPASEGFNFDDFVNGVMQENGKRQYRSKRVNEYSSPRVGIISFIPNPGENKYVWGIVSPADNRNINEWPLAQGGTLAPQGGIMKANGDGLVTIDNPCTQKRLVLDMRDPLNPQRTEINLPGPSTCPLRLLSLTLDPTTVRFRPEQNKSRGTVTLDGPVPKGGAVIDISASPSDVTSFLSFPLSVKVEPGQSSVSFEITVINNVPGVSVDVTFAAFFRGVERKSNLVVEGPPH